MTRMSQLLSDRDRTLVESLVYDPSLGPKFNALRSHLLWEDELPPGITPDGMDFLTILWVARAFIYHGFPLPDLFDPNHFRSAWDQAIEAKLQWPGFKRLSLSKEDKDFYQQKLQQDNPFD